MLLFILSILTLTGSIVVADIAYKKHSKKIMKLCLAMLIGGEILTAIGFLTFFAN